MFMTTWCNKLCLYYTEFDTCPRQIKQGPLAEGIAKVRLGCNQ